MESKYEKTKESIMLWRANNLDKYREQQRLYQRNYYKNNYEKVRKVQKQKTYIIKKEMKRFLNILLPPL